MCKGIEVDVGGGGGYERIGVGGAGAGMIGDHDDNKLNEGRKRGARKVTFPAKLILATRK